MIFTIYHLDNGMTISSRAEGTKPHDAFQSMQQDPSGAQFVSHPGLYMIYPTDNTGESANHHMSAVIQVVQTPSPIHDSIDQIEAVEPPRRTRRFGSFF